MSMSTVAVMSDDKQTQEIRMRTAPFDARFPNQNQTKHCWQNYVDYHRCHKVKGDDYEPCEYFKRLYQSLCPAEYVSKWDDQVAEGRLAAKI